MSRGQNGSNELFFLNLSDEVSADIIGAAEVLARRGVSMLKAKRTLELVALNGWAPIHLPNVEDKDAVIQELRAAGIDAKAAVVEPPVSEMSKRIKRLRKRYKLTQEDFAYQFGFELKTLQGWESGRKIDKGNRTYISLIERDTLGIVDLMARESQAEA